MVGGGELPLPCLVFVQSKERANELGRELQYDKLRVEVITADRPQPQRDRIVKKLRMGLVWVLVTTDLMARGMDFKGSQGSIWEKKFIFFFLFGIYLHFSQTFFFS